MICCLMLSEFTSFSVSMFMNVPVAWSGKGRIRPETLGKS
jgi:hypothetical protein